MGPILVGHDGSPAAERACAWSAGLAEALDERLIVGRGFSVGDSVGGPESGAALAGEELADLVASSHGWGLAPSVVSTVVHSGRTGPALVGMVRAEGAGLLTVGSRRRAHPGAALGRVVQHVTFRCPCPVAVVRRAGGAVSAAPLIVGVDVDNVNPDPLNRAMALARGLDTTLHVVAVGPDRSATEPTDELLHLLERDGGPATKYDRLSGDPAVEILSLADQLDAAAVVIGQRRGHNLGGRLLGRVAGSILRGNIRPTIVSSHD